MKREMCKLTYRIIHRGSEVGLRKALEEGNSCHHVRSHMEATAKRPYREGDGGKMERTLNAY